MQHLEGSGTPVLYIGRTVLNPLNAKLNPICHLLALLGAHHIFHVSRIRVKGYHRSVAQNTNFPGLLESKFESHTILWDTNTY